MTWFGQLSPSFFQMHFTPISFSSIVLPFNCPLLATRISPNWAQNWMNARGEGADQLMENNGMNKTDDRQIIGEEIDLSREGPIDRCMEMLAAKIMAPSFWAGAEEFVARPAPLGGYEGVRQALARHILSLFGVSVHWDQLQLVPNDSLALELFVRSSCAAEDVLLCPAPFADPELPITLSKGTPRTELMAVQLEDAPELSIADLQEASDRLRKQGRRVRAILLHNPHPMLSWVGDGQRRLAHILEWASEREIFLLVDESLAAMDLWEFSSCLGLLDHRAMGQWLVWVWSGAKHFSLPGLEFAAFLLPQPDLLCQALPLLQLHPCAPLVQYLAAKLLGDFDWTSDLFARRKSRLEELRRNTIEGLADLGVGPKGMVVSEEPTPWVMANLKMFLAAPNFESERALKEQLAKEASLLLTSGHELGMVDPGWLRIRVASSEERVADVLGRLKMVLASGRKGSETEWQRMDMSKYGGTTVIPEEEEEEESDQRGEEEEEEEEDKENVMEEKRMVEVAEEGKRDEQHPGRDEENDEEEEQIIRKRKEEEDIMGEEEKEEDEIIRKREQEKEIIRNERKEEEEEGDEIIGEEEDEIIPKKDEREVEVIRREEEDVIIREVFSIFPNELRWRNTLVSEVGISRKSKRDEELWNGSEMNMKEQRKESLGWKKTDTVHTTRLRDLSFIEELIKSGGGKRKEEEEKEGKKEGEFYEEASTEETEEEEEDEKRNEEGEGREEQREEKEEEGKEEQQHQHHHDPLSIEVPSRVSPKNEQNAEERRSMDYEERESKRIIEIIDQIFSEAVEIQDYSDVPDQSAGYQYHPDTGDQQDHQLWSRSDSGLAGESLPDLLVSPVSSRSVPIAIPITVPAGGDQYGDDTIRSGDSAFVSHPSPLFTTLDRRAKWTAAEGEDGGMEYEPARSPGTSVQMLDDSGIFVDLPPGSLSIDFPLLVRMEGEEEDKRRMMEVEEWKEEEGKEKRAGRTVVMFTQEELRAMIEDREVIGEPKEEGQWRPLEDVEDAEQPRRITSRESREEQEERDELYQDQQQTRLASVLNEGSTFCPSPTEKEKDSEIGKGRGVPEWKPLDQMEELEGPGGGGRRRMDEKYRKQTEERGKKFSEELDRLEEARKERRRSREEEEKEEREEAVDVVAGWNARLRKKMAEAEEKVDLDLFLVGTEEQSAVQWTTTTGPENNWAGKTVINLEEGPRRKEVEAEEDEEWRNRWRGPELERQRWMEGGRDAEDGIKGIPGRSRYSQTHQRMLMGRRPDDHRSRRNKDESIIIEHINITELEYRGRRKSAERIHSSIGTRINRWAADEWFDRLPTGENLERMDREEEEGRKKSRKGRRTEAEEAEGVEYVEVVECRNPNHSRRGDHCDPSRVYTVRRSTRTDGEKTNRDGRVKVIGVDAADQPIRLHSEFETVQWSEAAGGGTMGRTRHRHKRTKGGQQRWNRSPNRITVSTSRGDGGQSIDRMTVPHTPGSRWVVSSVYRTTDWGWEKTTLQ